MTEIKKVDTIANRNIYRKLIIIINIHQFPNNIDHN